MICIKLYILCLIIKFGIYVYNLFNYVVASNQNHLEFEKIVNLCTNVTCPYRHACIPTFNIKNYNLEKECSCICENKDACNAKNFDQNCYCDGIIFYFNINLLKLKNTEKYVLLYLLKMIYVQDLIGTNFVM